MKEVPLNTVGDALRALVEEARASGEDVILTHEGKPVARIGVEAGAGRGANERRAAMQRILARTDDIARDFPPSTRDLSWDVLKRWMHDEDKWDEILG